MRKFWGRGDRVVTWLTGTLTVRGRKSPMVLEIPPLLLHVLSFVGTDQVRTELGKLQSVPLLCIQRCD